MVKLDSNCSEGTERTNSLFELAHSLAAQMVKNLPATQETQVQSLGEEDPLEKGMATGTWQQVGDSMSHRLARKFLTLEGGV